MESEIMELLNEGKPPDEMDFNRDLAVAWKSFKLNYKIYSIIKKVEARSEKFKALLLLRCIGQKGRDVYNSLVLPEEDRFNLAKILNLLDEKFNHNDGMVSIKKKSKRKGATQKKGNVMISIAK